MNIVLTGFMASGKTSISEEIARISGMRLIDTDEMAVRRSGMSINDIFEQRGENAFRKLEHSIITEISNMDNCVVSTGGGVPLNKENMQALRSNGIIFNLAPDFEVILSRLDAARGTRPLIKDSETEEIRARFEQRKPFYADCDYSIHVTDGRDPASYAVEILELFRKRLSGKRERSSESLK